MRLALRSPGSVSNFGMALLRRTLRDRYRLVLNLVPQSLVLLRDRERNSNASTMWFGDEHANAMPLRKHR